MGLGECFSHHVSRAVGVALRMKGREGGRVDEEEAVAGEGREQHEGAGVRYLLLPRSNIQSHAAAGR